MTKQNFNQLVEKNIIYLDGATGSNLIKRGMPAGVNPETWILENKETFIALQREYVEAGTNILYAPTFTSNRVKLEEYGLADQIVRINKELVAFSKEAAGDVAYVAGNLTMTGRQLIPIGDMGFEELISIYKEQIIILEEAGVDLLVVETMMSLQETRAAVIAAKEVSELPVMVTLTFESDGRTLFGTDAKTAAIVMESLGVVAIGANCSTGPDKMCQIISDMASVTEIPIIAKPNAGLPFLNENGETVYDMDAETFGAEMVRIVESGATILGGCCGTTPEYISLLKKSTSHILIEQSLTNRKKALSGVRMLTSERKSLLFTLDENFIVIGERINPTGKKALQAQLRAADFEMVENFAEEQEASGAKILDINVGMSGIDEKEIMLKALEEVANVTSLPLAIDSSYIDVIEEALRVYPGRALINSISLETEKFEKLIPIAKKYGAMFILLPLSDKGLPENIQEKIEIIHKIMERALSFGMKKEDIVVDGLVTTVGANKNAAVETLETIRYCKSIGLATVCGLSNISFGLPERSFVNTAFLTMAIASGLTMAIANPNQELLVNTALATDLLLNKEDADSNYIVRMNDLKEKKELQFQKDIAEGRINPEQRITSSQTMSVKAKDIDLKKEQVTATGGNVVVNSVNQTEDETLLKLKEAVLKGQKKVVVDLTKKAMSEGSSPKMILDETLLPAINEVGDLFDKGRYFLPQLIGSAETMKLSIEYLEPFLVEESDGKEAHTIVMATVKGDIHDIGKNLVVLMLKNYGFQVIDLGKDVPKEVIVETAKKNNAKIIGLSALMTTTMLEMKQVINYAREQGVFAKVMIGGAVITEDYAKEIGADGYSKDAAEAVKLAQKLVEME